MPNMSNKLDKYIQTKPDNLFGTKPENLDSAEQQLGFRFAPSFRAWLLVNNGSSAEGLQTYPVADERRPWDKWNTVVQKFADGQWFPEALEDDEEDYRCLLPFADASENWYCFDYSRKREDGEVPVVHFQHDPGERTERGATFTEFVERLASGEFEYD